MARSVLEGWPPKLSVDQSWMARRTLGLSATSCRIVACIGSIKADSWTRGSMQNRHSFWAKEAGLIPPTVAPGPGAVLEPVFPNPLTSMA